MALRDAYSVFQKYSVSGISVNGINPMGPICFQLNKTENDNGSSTSKKQLQNVKPSRGSYFAKIFEFYLVTPSL